MRKGCEKIGIRLISMGFPGFYFEEANRLRGPPQNEKTEKTAKSDRTTIFSQPRMIAMTVIGLSAT